MELTNYKEKYLNGDSVECIEALQKIYINLQQEISILQSKLDDSEKRIFEIYQPIIKSALSLSSKERLEKEEREKYFKKAEEIATLLVEKQDKINDRTTQVILEKERTRRFLIGTGGVIMISPFIIKGIEKIVEIIKKR